MWKLQNRLAPLRCYNIFFMVACVLFLQGCTGSSGNWQGGRNGPAAQHTPNDLSVAGVEGRVLGDDLNEDRRSVAKVALLLPLTGKHATLGRSMLNAAQMALFDIGYDGFELLPYDTKGTPEGARRAAQLAVQNDSNLVLGPVFSPSVRAAQQVTKSARINMIAFSTDWTLAGGHTFLIGLLPFDQVSRVTRYAAANGYGRIGVISPADEYGDAVVSAYVTVAQRIGLAQSRIERFSPDNNSLGPVMRGFSDYDVRKDSQDVYGPPFDAVLMPVGGTVAREVGSFLNHYDLPARQVRRLGTGLMDDPALAQDGALDGAWFAAPDPHARQRFETHYVSLFGEAPPRIAALAYDATALAAILGHMGTKEGRHPAYHYNSQAITNPNGFSGVDGIFRFMKDGRAERGLAVLEYRNGQIVVIDKAPGTFQNTAF